MSREAYEKTRDAALAHNQATGGRMTAREVEKKVAEVVRQADREKSESKRGQSR